MKLRLTFILLLICSVGVSSATSYSTGLIWVTNTDDANNLSQLRTFFNGVYNESYTQENILNETSSKIWWINGKLGVTDATGPFYINDTDVDELRCVKRASDGWAIKGYVQVNDVNLTSWNNTNNVAGTLMLDDGHFASYYAAHDVNFYGFRTVWFGYDANSITITDLIYKNITLNQTRTGLSFQGAENVTVDDVYIHHGHPIAGTGIHLTTMDNSTLSNIRIINVSDYNNPATGAYGIYLKGDNNVVRDVYINGTSWSGILSSKTGNNASYYNVTIINSGHNGFEMQSNFSYAENITVCNSDDHNFFQAGTEEDSQHVHGNIFENIYSDSPGSYGIVFGEGSYNSSVRNSTFIGKGVYIVNSEDIEIFNITQTGINPSSSTGLYTSVYEWVTPSFWINRNNTIIDSSLLNNSYKDIWINIGTDIILINTEYSTLKLGTGNYTKNYYADIKIISDNGSAIENAVIKITNTTYKTFNGIGTKQFNFSSLATGYTSLPNENRSNSPVISYSYTNTSITVYPVYSISVSKSGYETNSSVTLTANENYYRTNPDTHQNTTTIILTSTSATSTLTIPANSWGIFNNWTSQTTFAAIAANECNDQCLVHYNGTNGIWESYYVGYNWNSDYPISQDDGCMIYVDAETNIVSQYITPTNTSLKEGWNMLALQGTSNKTISEITADMRYSP